MQIHFNVSRFASLTLSDGDMNRKNIYHVCSQSPIIVFRKEADYIHAINRLASCAYSTRTEILAFCIMSTHFHLIIMGDNVDDFISLYKRNITFHHYSTYNTRIKVQVGKRLLMNNYEILIALNYVIKNPVHHGVTETPLSYEYSSIYCYFQGDLNRGNLFYRDRVINKNIKRAGDIHGRKYRQLFSSLKVAEDYRVLNNTVVLPDSFINIDFAETIYENPRKFLFQINRPLAEDVKIFGDDIEAINRHLKKSILTGAMSDTQVCEIIDTYLQPRHYHQVTEFERVELWRRLERKGISYGQFHRALGLV